MQPQYDSWQKAGHHAVAVCVDCHLPHDFSGRYLAKADNGWHHSRGFTLQDFHELVVGVAWADCHMPYQREGATKVSDHWVRSPLLNVNRACQTCHRFSEDEILARVDAIQQRNFELLQRGGKALMDWRDQ